MRDEKDRLSPAEIEAFVGAMDFVREHGIRIVEVTPGAVDASTRGAGTEVLELGAAVGSPSLAATGVASVAGAGAASRATGSGSLQVAGDSGMSTKNTDPAATRERRPRSASSTRASRSTMDRPSPSPGAVRCAGSRRANSRNTSARFSSAMPRPVSHTSMRTRPSG
jgi:hypothetical protein